MELAAENIAAEVSWMSSCIMVVEDDDSTRATLKKVNADSVIDRVSDLLLQTKQSSDHFLVDQLELKELTTH